MTHQRQVVLPVQGHGTELTHIVAPHGCYVKRSFWRLVVMGLKAEGLGQQRPAVTGLQTIELGHGFADVHGNAWARLMDWALHPGQLHGLLTLKRANQQT